MDNLVSGSIIESRVAPNSSTSSSHNKRNIIQIIIIAVETIIIFGLIVGLILLTNNQQAEIVETEEEGWLEEEETLYQLSDSEAMALMYVYSIVNNNQIKAKNMPTEFCELLATIYNSSSDATKMENPCNNNQAIFIPANNIEEDLASIGELYIGIGADSSAYNLYVSSDFSYIGRATKVDSEPTGTVIVNLNSD